MDVKIKRTMDYDVKCYKDVKIKLKYLSTGEAADVMEYVPAELDIEGNEERPARMAYDTTKMLKYMVMEIENLTVTDENNKKIEINKGTDIVMNPGLDKLYLEILPVLMKMDARVDAKN